MKRYLETNQHPKHMQIGIQGIMSINNLLTEIYTAIKAAH
jgi:hypothetical protein